MATKEEKALIKAEKQAVKADKQAIKAEAKAEQQALKADEKAEKQVVKAYQKDQQASKKTYVKAITQSHKAPAKVARKETKQERNRKKAIDKARTIPKNFMDLPPALWPLVILVAFSWLRNALDKERQERDVREARRFLREWNDPRRKHQL